VDRLWFISSPPCGRLLKAVSPESRRPLLKNMFQTPRGGLRGPQESEASSPPPQPAFLFRVLTSVRGEIKIGNTLTQILKIHTVLLTQIAQIQAGFAPPTRNR
jgi:hypothetical protein